LAYTSDTEAVTVRYTYAVSADAEAEVIENPVGFMWVIAPSLIDARIVMLVARWNRPVTRAPVAVKRVDDQRPPINRQR
jgi:hypothetical protein